MIHESSYVSSRTCIQHSVGVHGHVVVVLLLLPVQGGLDPSPELVHGDKLADVLDQEVALLDVGQRVQAPASCRGPEDLERRVDSPLESLVQATITSLAGRAFALLHQESVDAIGIGSTRLLRGGIAFAYLLVIWIGSVDRTITKRPKKVNQWSLSFIRRTGEVLLVGFDLVKHGRLGMRVGLLDFVSVGLLAFLAVSCVLAEDLGGLVEATAVSSVEAGGRRHARNFLGISLFVQEASASERK